MCTGICGFTENTHIQTCECSGGDSSQDHGGRNRRGVRVAEAGTGAVGTAHIPRASTAKGPGTSRVLSPKAEEQGFWCPRAELDEIPLPSAGKNQPGDIPPRPCPH